MYSINLMITIIQVSKITTIAVIRIISRFTTITYHVTFITNSI